MRAGFARREITPAYSTPMAGFDRRTSPSTGTLDPLYVSVLAVDDGAGVFLLCSFDLLGVDNALCAAVRARAEEKFGIPQSRIISGATHTHSAPGVHFAGRASHDSAYTARLIGETMAAAEEALADLRDCTLTFTGTSVTGVASRRNRGREGAQFPMPLLVFRFRRPDDVLTLCRFACHSTVLDEKNTLFSADLPGAARKLLGEKSIFFNGACADLSTRFTRLSSDSSELARLGGILAEGVLTAPDGERYAGLDIRTSAETIFLSRPGGLEGKARDTLLAALREKAATCTDRQAWREYDSRIAVLERQNVQPEPEKPVYIAAADFGPFVFLTLPFETGSEDCENLERSLSEAAGKPVYLICYCGGYDGYLPSGASLTADSSYEDIASRYGEGTRQQVWECAKRCILGVK